MSSEGYLVEPKPAPKLNAPSSSSTVDVRLLNSTAYGKGNPQIVLDPHIEGHDVFTFPCFSFLITNSKGDKVLFDLGIRKDYENMAPVVASRCSGENPLFQVKVEKNISEILDEDSAKLGFSSKDIHAVIYSHHHWDHIGDIKTFPSSTDLVVGPGFQGQYLPGYPTNPDSPLLDADFKGRNVREIDESSFSLKIGRCPAFDYFGDGSFYLLSTPGHTVGHICGLARTTPDTFVFMGGDCCHHGGEFRPTEFLPLPKSIPPPATRKGVGACPGAYFQEQVHPFKSATRPFYDVAQGFSHDHDEAVRSIGKLQDFDANDDVLTIIAHDSTLLDNLDFYPKKLNDWKAKDHKKQVLWSFCGDFKVDEAKASQY